MHILDNSSRNNENLTEASNEAQKIIAHRPFHKFLSLEGESVPSNSSRPCSSQNAPKTNSGLTLRPAARSATGFMALQRTGFHVPAFGTSGISTELTTYLRVCVIGDGYDSPTKRLCSHNVNIVSV
ncbi:hypothetical protein EVAR_46016_1 [Eumeta japonica]|uniref:Uncharacterized protein n=1 Tax=Eumeta variegata TaxID=151549 RepID=A0A4C1Z6M7_EUMVA|nr:hypothetical protein EVAR_46016_1 [Eumeta japonica]